MHIHIPPCWTIVGPGNAAATEVSNTGTRRIVLETGPGFGDGRHPTTVLCMQGLAALAPRKQGVWRMLDFGSGSGILAIAAAKLGAHATAIEIDEQAIEHARANARLNSVSGRIALGRSLEPTDGAFELVVANILRQVLLDHAPALAARIAPGGALVLSGLLSTDVPEVSVRYASLFGGRRPEIYERGEWRALAWRAHGSGAR
ncbi:MAG: 50S ribosomal protein L11 methyltransferase [Polyangiaceae bacterium]|nr:50S ribosomal protein L11 methyltransferase [Polyangiaceae bacterium]